MSLNGKPTPEDLERYRGYLRLIAEMQMNVRLKAKEDASDIVQQVMLYAFKDLANFRGHTEAELKSWLTVMTSNVIAKMGRSYSRQCRTISREVSLEIQLEQSSAVLHRSLIGNEKQPGESLMVREDIDRLIEALLQLLDDERTAIVMKHLHNIPIAQIAIHLGRTENAVGGLLGRGLAKLRTKLFEPA